MKYYKHAHVTHAIYRVEDDGSTYARWASPNMDTSWTKCPWNIAASLSIRIDDFVELSEQEVFLLLL
jgi:hypothetical protein